MNFSKALQVIPRIGAAALLTAAAPPTAARANIYATDIRLNGDTNNLPVATGGQAAISYILNEPAILGASIDILSGTNIVRSISLTNGEPGALRGTNTVSWDLRDNASNAVPVGNYSVRITAATGGYTNWTQITDDSNVGNYVWEGSGIGVDRNPDSVYFGRVYVANSYPGIGGLPGDNVGLLRLNADGSPAEEGEWTTGGYNWAGDTLSPWHVEVADDEHVYVEDWTSSGVVLRWDAAISTNSQLQVLGAQNWATNHSGGLVSLAGPAISGSSTHGSLWMADTTQGSLGILRYTLTTNGTVAADDFGTTVVGVTNDVSLTNVLNLQPFDVALDKAGNIYTIQSTASPGDPRPRVLRFPAYDPSTNAGAPELYADWAVGGGDDSMGSANGIAVDPTGTYVAVAFEGVQFGPFLTNGCTQVFYASNGVQVANLDLGVTISGEITHQDTDVGWDGVGNVYYTDDYSQNAPVWRAFSPPGTNQFTTMAVPVIQVGSGGGAGGPVTITGIQVSGGMVTIQFTGVAGDSASSFALLASPVAEGPYTNTLAQITAGAGPGQFQATLPASQSLFFYRIQRLGGPPPTGQITITGIAVSGQNVELEFTAPISDSAADFTIVSASQPQGPYTNTTATVVSGIVPGKFAAQLPRNGAAQFYRVKK